MMSYVTPTANERSSSVDVIEDERKRSLDVADRIIESLGRRFYLLATHPHIGRPRDEDLRPGLRSFAVGAYVILYRIDADDVLVLRVIHGGRDIQALLRH